MPGPNDAVVREVLRSHFLAVVEAMGHTIGRTSHSTFVKESADFVAALVTVDGEVFAYSRDIGVSSFLGLNLSAVLAAVDPQPGDVVITNDPYSSAGLVTHLPDLHLIKPVFVGAELTCWAWCFVHCSDVGGLAPTSISARAYDVRQEGLRIAPQKLVRGGAMVQELLDLMLANSRSPRENLGDINAMLGALSLGESRMQQVASKFGLPVVIQAMTDMLDWTEQVARAEFARIPDGSYSFTDYLDDDLAGAPVRLAVTLTVDGSGIVLDYAGTDPQVAAAFNLPGFGDRHPFLAQGLINFVLTRNPSAPLTGGIMRPIRTVAPPGSIVNPHFPAAVGTRYATVIRLYNVVLGALAQALPGEIPAAGCGASAIVSVSVPELEHGGTKVSVLEPLQGGGGASARGDGVSGSDSAAGYLRNTPVESIEAAVPVLVLRYELAADSAGAGRSRGGWGTVFGFRLLRPNSVVMSRGMERCRFEPWGLDGGTSSPRTRSFLNPGSDAQTELGAIDVLDTEPGDVVVVWTSGGGGYGDPLDRDVGQVGEDLRSGLMSRRFAREHYGVVSDEHGPDLTGTERLRSQLRSTRTPPEPGHIDFGPARTEYERLWTPQASEALCRLLYGLPPSLRSYAKREIHRAVDRDPAGPVADRIEKLWKHVQAAVSPSGDLGVTTAAPRLPE